MEASTIQTPAALCPPRITIGPRLLKLRSDEQLVALFREGHDEAFQVIHDRYQKRLESYARQMLAGRQDAEDVLQDVFVRAYRALHADNRQLALKPWLFRITYNRCIDQLRQASPPPPEVLAATGNDVRDVVVQADTRESLRRLIADIQRLPEQQRAALLLRELSGISYEEVAAVLATTAPAVKSLLVRARMGLLRASDARDTACSEIREQMVLAHDQGVRAGSTVRHHLRDCSGCRSYRRELTLVRRRLAVLLPAGPLVTLAKLVGLPGGSATGTSGAAPAAAVGGGTASGVAVGANHVAALLAAAVASAGGAVGLQHVIAAPSHTAAGTAAAHRHHHRAAPSSSGLVPGSRATVLAPGRANTSYVPPRARYGLVAGGTTTGWVPDRSARVHRGHGRGAGGAGRGVGSGLGVGTGSRGTGTGVTSGGTNGGSTGTGSTAPSVPATGAWPSYGTGSGTSPAGSGSGPSSTGSSSGSSGSSGAGDGSTTTGDTTGSSSGTGDPGSSSGSTTGTSSDGSSSGQTSPSPPPPTTTS